MRSVLACLCLLVLLPAPFSAEEDAILVAQQSRIGNKWAVIAKSLPGRTDNAVKNRWNTVLLRQQLEAHAAAECGALANGERQQDCLSGVLGCALLLHEWSGGVADTDGDMRHADSSEDTLMPDPHGDWSQDLEALDTCDATQTTVEGDAPQTSKTTVKDLDTWDRTQTTETTLTHFSGSSSPTNESGPLAEDSEMFIQGLERHTYLHDAHAQTPWELSLSPGPVCMKMGTCLEALGQGLGGSQPASSVATSFTASSVPTSWKPVSLPPASLSLQSRDVRWSAPRTMRTNPETHASIDNHCLEEGEEGCLTTPVSPRAHVLHMSVLRKLFQQSAAMSDRGEASGLKLVRGSALCLDGGQEADEPRRLTADEEASGLKERVKLSSAVPVRPTPAQALTQTHAVAASAHVKDGVAASAHASIAASRASEMCESLCYGAADRSAADRSAADRSAGDRSAGAELPRHSASRFTPKTLLQTPKTLLQSPVEASAAGKRRQIAQLHAHACAHAQHRVKRDSARQRTEEVVACRSDLEMRHGTCSGLASLNAQSACLSSHVIRTHVCDHFEPGCHNGCDGATGRVAVDAVKMVLDHGRPVTKEVDHASLPDSPTRTDNLALPARASGASSALDAVSRGYL
jgi:hypothetical protein